MKKLLLLPIFILAFLNSVCGNIKDNSKPNIVLILADDLGWADVGYNGNNNYETPSIDKIASEGMILSRFYPSAANCSPTRASILTGVYSPRHHVYIPNGMAEGDIKKRRFMVPTEAIKETHSLFQVNINHLDPGFESLAEMLKRGGYVSARLGKWHIGNDNQGFDLSSSNGIPSVVTNMNGEEERFYEDTTVNKKLTDMAIQFITDNRNNPFFLYLAHWEVHSPMAAIKERIQYFSEKFKNMGRNDLNPVYAAEAEQIDISVDRIVQTLKQYNLENNTILIFTSDNGGLQKYTRNEPLRAGKGTFYEGGIRTPCFVYWPGVVKSGTKTDVPVSGIDFMPTFAELAGIEVPRNQPVDGKSIVPMLKDHIFESDRSLFFHFPLYLGSGDIQSRVLPVFNTGELFWRAVPSTTIIKGDWKMIWYYEYDKYELFNIREDISEKNDLAGQCPETEENLIKEIRNWVKDVDAPVPNIELNKK